MSILEKKRMNHPRWDESELPDNAFILGSGFCIYDYGRYRNELRKRVFDSEFNDYTWKVASRTYFNEEA